MSLYVINVIEKMFDSNYYSTKLIIRDILLKKNINFFRSKIPKRTKIIAVVKANAYGYGDISISNKLIDVPIIG